MKYVLFTTLTTVIVGVTAVLGALHHPLWFCVTGTGFCVAFLSSLVVKERKERFRRDFDALTSKHKGLEKSSGDLETRCDRLLSALLAINAELPDAMRIRSDFDWSTEPLVTRVRQLMGLFPVMREMLDAIHSPCGPIGAFVYDRLDADASLYRGSVSVWCEFLDLITGSARKIQYKMTEIKSERDTLQDGFLDLARQFVNLIIYLRTVEAPDFVKVSGRGKFASWCAAPRMNISYLLVTCVMETGKSLEEFREMVERGLRPLETDLTFSDLFFPILDRAEQMGGFHPPRELETEDTFLLTPDWARDVRAWVVPERLRQADEKSDDEPEATPPAASAWETCPQCASTNMEVYVDGGNFQTTCRACGHTTHTSLQI